MAIEGYIDGIKGAFLIGWAHDPARPGDRVELDVVLDGKPIGRCVADLKRGDLLKNGIGDGRHGFRLKLPQALEPGGDHIVAVRGLADGTPLPLANDYLADPTGGSNGRQLTLALEPNGRPADAGSGDAGGSAKPSPAEQAGSPAAVAPAPAPRALLGTGGWLFAHEGAERLARVLGGLPLSPDRVQERVRMLRVRHKRLTELGIGYLVVTVPAKAAVYAEYLPSGIEARTDGRPADELAAVLRDDIALELMDLLPVLRHARRHGRVFLRQGNQLTWSGAFHAYRAVAKELSKRFPEIQPPAVGALELGDLIESTDPLRARERVALVGGELVTVAISDDDVEREPDLKRSRMDAMYAPLPANAIAQLGAGAALLERAAGSDLPRAVVFQDGGAERLVPFLAEHFSRTLVDVSDKLPIGLIEREQPLVVIQILAEEGPFFA